MNGIMHVLIQDWRSAIYVVIKTLALFTTAALAFRFLQRRAIAQFTPFDWLTAVVSGSVIGRSATATDTTWIGGITAVLTVIAINAAVTRLRFVPGLRDLIDPPLYVLIRDGQVSRGNLTRCGLTQADLDAILRQNGYLNETDVKLAVFERTGSISVLVAPAETGLSGDSAPAKP